jgi:hypothetical protein
MTFVLIAIVGMYLGRKLGWGLAKAVLYPAPKAVFVAASIAWGCLVALLIHILINWQHPHWVLKFVFGFALGWYVAIPNFGLFTESTIPPYAVKRHLLISFRPPLAYLISSVVLAYFL